jgi:hypothetical protein
MKILAITLLTLYVLLYIWVAYDINRNKQRLSWTNLVVIVFAPYLWPFIYFFTKKKPQLRRR